jgi:hypothetical protein
MVIVYSPFKGSTHAFGVREGFLSCVSNVPLIEGVPNGRGGYHIPLNH